MKYFLFCLDVMKAYDRGYDWKNIALEEAPSVWRPTETKMSPTYIFPIFFQ